MCILKEKLLLSVTLKGMHLSPGGCGGTGRSEAHC